MQIAIASPISFAADFAQSIQQLVEQLEILEPLKIPFLSHGITLRKCGSHPKPPLTERKKRANCNGFLAFAMRKLRAEQYWYAGERGSQRASELARSGPGQVHFHRSPNASTENVT